MLNFANGHPQILRLSCLLCGMVSLMASVASAQFMTREERRAKVEKTLGDPPGMKRLSEKDRVWVDTKKHIVVVDGYIAMREGQLEMFACPAATKEHESVVGLLTKAQDVHAGLLAAGAKAGKPVQWEPEFKTPTGSEIEIHALWFDKDGKKKTIDARQWCVRWGKEKKVLDVNWVFAGSSFWKDPETGESRYQAEAGDLVCLSNFSTATLDLPIQSSQANSGLLFVANTELIPPEMTPVRLVFKVVKPEKSDKPAPAGEKPAPQEDLLTPAKP